MVPNMQKLRPQLDLRLDAASGSKDAPWHEGGVIAYLGGTLKLVLDTAAREPVRIDGELHLPLPPAATARQIHDAAESWLRDEALRLFSEKSALAGRQHLPHAAFALLCDALPADWRQQFERLGAVAVHLDAQRVDAAVVQTLAGIPWAVWTVNDAATAARLYGLGAAAIFTDRPDHLQ